MPFIDNAHAVTEFFDFVHDVGRINNGASLAAVASHKVQHGATRHHVQPAGRLVKKDDGRVV